MTKTGIFVGIITALLTFEAAAQNPSIKQQLPISSPLLGSGDHFLKKTVDSAIYIVRVDYVLREVDTKNPEDFGRDTLKYFGRAYGIAYACEDRLWFDTDNLKPWENVDKEQYEEVKDESAFKPVVSAVQYRHWNGRKFVSVNLDSIQSQEVTVASIPFRRKPQLEKGVVPEDSSDLAVLLYVDHKIGSDSIVTRLDVHEVSVSRGEKTISVRVNALRSNARKNPVGGVYCSVQIRTGSVKIQGVGIISTNMSSGKDMKLLVPKSLIAKPVLKPIKNPPSPSVNKKKGKSSSTTGSGR